MIFIGCVAACHCRLKSNSPNLGHNQIDHCSLQPCNYPSNNKYAGKSKSNFIHNFLLPIIII